MNHSVTLYYVMFDDESFLYGNEAHAYHAYYFFNEEVARYAANGFVAAVKKAHGFEPAYVIRNEYLSVTEASVRVAALAERMKATRCAAYA